MVTQNEMHYQKKEFDSGLRKKQLLRRSNLARQARDLGLSKHNLVQVSEKLGVSMNVAGTLRSNPEWAMLADLSMKNGCAAGSGEPMFRSAR